MAAMIFLFLNLVASLFKSKSRRLEAGDAALRRQLIVLQRKVRGRSQPRSPVLHPAVSLVSIGPQGHQDHSARDPGALASCRFLPLLALEISESGRPAANQCGFAVIESGG
jgi:hypothetical protein